MPFVRPESEQLLDTAGIVRQRKVALRHNSPAPKTKMKPNATAPGRRDQSPKEIETETETQRKRDKAKNNAHPTTDPNARVEEACPPCSLS